MLWGLFENYSSTDLLKGKDGFNPFKIKLSSEKAMDILEMSFVKEGYKNIKSCKSYCDLYLEDDGFEITYLFGSDSNGKTIVNVAVYGEKKKGKTRKRLKAAINDAKKILNIYID